MSKNVFIAVHGHFYQPPRENPWLEEIEAQDTAAPFHDWNERIYHECYLPNATARVLDEHGKIIDIVNNYESISFNFGPTLLTWLQHKHPEIYQRIIEADKKSLSAQNGHGNAIAQAYSHLIMPLANTRDKETQVRWGIEEFKFRFNRAPESMWLPETACNEQTLEVLVAHGIRFIILEPNQAEAVRPLGHHDWQDVSSGTIDPKHPYRCFLKNNPHQFIDIFFYDGPISKDIGFANLAFDAKIFVDRLIHSIDHHNTQNQIIHTATDGETYGHHKAFGERALAYLLQREIHNHNIQLTNYGEYLSKNLPQHEVKLKEGINGLGTSWSCAHGVGRWMENCGCRGGGPASWTQHWRKPLREALDWLRDELSKVYEEFGGKYLKNPWEARNQYIRVVLDRSDQNVKNFLSEQAHSLNDIPACLKLLEMQRHAMQMYTSCGWFFTELSGIETVQIMQYAARAIQLARELTGKSLEEEFVERLFHAKSNVAEFKDGRGVYEKLIRPKEITLNHIAAYYAITSLFDDDETHRDEVDLYCFKLKIHHYHSESFGNLKLTYGRASVKSQLTWEEKDLAFTVLQFGLYDFRCCVKDFTEEQKFESEGRVLSEALHSLDLVGLLRKIDSFFGDVNFSLRDLPYPERHKIVSTLSKEAIEKISAAYETLYAENSKMNKIYRDINLPIPAEIRFAVQHTLGKQLELQLKKLSAAGFQAKKAQSVSRTIETARSLGVEIKTEAITHMLSHELAQKARLLAVEMKAEFISECLYILRIAKKLGTELEIREAQDYLFNFLQKSKQGVNAAAEIINNPANHLAQLVTNLNMHPHLIPKSASKQEQAC